jgi:hypothetical protein
MLTDKDYHDLMKSNVNAWAIWGSYDPNEYADEVWEKYRDKLKPGLILLGLNPSQKLIKYRNFHHPGKGNDTKLKNWIQGEGDLIRKEKDGELKPKLPNLFGAFMTDLVHNQFEKKSTNVTITKSDVEAFVETLEKLGRKKYQIICFGNDVYNAAKTWLINEEIIGEGVFTANNQFKQYKIELYKVMHYSFHHGKNRTGKQLYHLNSIL